MTKACINKFYVEALACKKIMDDFSKSMATAVHKAEGFTKAVSLSKRTEQTQRNRRKRFRKKLRGKK